MNLRRCAYGPMLACLAACAGEGREPEPADADTTVASPPADTIPQTAEAEFTPVALPAEFPPNFPIPPGGTVTRATVEPDVAGTYANVTVMTRSDPAEAFEWYVAALADAGWHVTRDSVAGEPGTLHAEQGESYIDLTVAPDLEAHGWNRVDAAIWRAAP